MSRIILTCNAGSSNTKLAAFDAQALTCVKQETTFTDVQLTDWFGAMNAKTITAIAHRVVHGGRSYTKPQRITPEVLATLKSYIPLAPLHQPAAITLIEQAQQLYPNLPHIACFDTAFHNTMPDIQRRFAIPQNLHDEGLHRYGFHGLSYQHIAGVMPEHERVIVAHLGGGASACAMLNRASVASTMGFSTLDGLMMGTRCGALDAGVLLYLLQEKNMTAEQLSDLLYQQCGLKGVSNICSDMQTLLASNEPAAKLAIELFCHMAAKEIAGLLPALGGIDALTFTGGIGEHAEPIREKITALLRWAGDFSVHVIPTDEELVMAQAAKDYNSAAQLKAAARWENEGGATKNKERTKNAH